MIRRCVAIFLALCLSINAIHLRQGHNNNIGTHISNMSLKQYRNLSEASQRLYEILVEENEAKVAALLLD